MQLTAKNEGGNNGSRISTRAFVDTAASSHLMSRGIAYARAGTIPSFHLWIGVWLFLAVQTDCENAVVGEHRAFLLGIIMQIWLINMDNIRDRAFWRRKISLFILGVLLVVDFERVGNDEVGSGSWGWFFT